MPESLFTGVSVSPPLSEQTSQDPNIDYELVWAQLVSSRDAKYVTPPLLTPEDCMHLPLPVSLVMTAIDYYMCTSSGIVIQQSNTFFFLVSRWERPVATT